MEYLHGLRPRMTNDGRRMSKEFQDPVLPRVRQLDALESAAALDVAIHRQRHEDRCGTLRTSQLARAIVPSRAWVLAPRAIATAVLASREPSRAWVMINDECRMTNVDLITNANPILPRAVVS